jgi:hypothetical protein
MGIPLDIFSLYQLRGEDASCQHYLLLRVGQPAFHNADEVDYARAVEISEQKKHALIERYTAEILTNECCKQHKVNLVGELQTHPTGDELIEGDGEIDVDIWVAETRFGYPWVVLGTAASEDEFWQLVEQDDELVSLGASHPAKKQRVYFLTENR